MRRNGGLAAWCSQQLGRGLCASRPCGFRTSLHEVDTTVSNLSETGNSITGAFTSTDTPTLTTTLHQSGTTAGGTFSLSETSSDHPSVTTTGNSTDGTQTVTTTGSQGYTLSETDTSGADSYTLAEHGTKGYTRTEQDDEEDGASTSTETGTDSYSLGETGSVNGGGYTQSVTGTDPYTTTDRANSQTGAFSSVTTGTDIYVNGSVSGSNAFGDADAGNTFSGTDLLTQQGTDRYGLLAQFNNTADGANGGVGLADYSPVGLAVSVDRTSTTAGTFSTVGRSVQVQDTRQFAFGDCSASDVLMVGKLRS